MVKLFADACVLYATVILRADHTRRNDNLDKLLKWCGTWRMDLNIGKYSVLHYSYSIGEVRIKE